MTESMETEPRADELTEIEGEIEAFEQETFRRGGQNSERLHLTLDRKVSPQGWYQEKDSRWVASIPNSFGLPAGESCPGSTEFCESICYGVNSENGKDVGSALKRNLQLLQEAGDVPSMKRLLWEAVDRYSRFADARRVLPEDRIFRIHWDGDFFSEDYAEAWAQTIRDFPDIQFWAYTRSFVDPVDVVPLLYDIPNLQLYLSVDKYNADVAHQLIQQYPKLLLAECAEDYTSTRELARGRLSVVCPENMGRLMLMDKDGVEGSHNGQGACVGCRLCPEGKVDVQFSTLHIQDVSQRDLFSTVPIPEKLRKQPKEISMQ